VFVNNYEVVVKLTIK